jgi:transcriptional regulator with GAF, ATPase, and Fis domain
MSGLRELPPTESGKRLTDEQVIEAMRMEGFIVGNSEAMKLIVGQVATVAQTDLSILVLGETGTGKGLLAKVIHRLSPWRDKPFETLDCAALPENLAESELFGCVRGAFTGATDRPGAFERASGGTLHLPDITELPLHLQPKLLRVLNDKKVRRVGGDRDIDVDVRVIADTNRDIVTEVWAGRFRRDLYYRLNPYPIVLPPLRERREDIAPLVKHFIAKHRARVHRNIESMSPAALERLGEYVFDGNVRELEAIVIRAMLDASASVIGPESVRPEDRPSEALVPEPSGNGRQPTLDEMVRAAVRERIAFYGGNRTRAARSLGIDRGTLYDKVKAIAPGSQDPSPATAECPYQAFPERGKFPHRWGKFPHNSRPK